MSGPYGAGSPGSGKRSDRAGTEPVVITREVGAKDLVTQTVTLLDERPFAQLLGVDPDRRDGANVFIDPTLPGNVRAFLCGSQVDAQQHRNGVPMLSGGPLYGYEVDGGVAAFVYLDPAIVGTVNALGGINIYAIYTSGENPPAAKPTVKSGEQSEA